ncbi:MAG: hypothetical protein ACI93R_002063, partial [Flavobacteriales bacterium]
MKDSILLDPSVYQSASSFSFPQSKHGTQGHKD